MPAANARRNPVFPLSEKFCEKWIIHHKGYRAIEKSRKWDVAQSESRAVGKSRKWDDAQLGCRAVEMSRNWVVAQMGCGADGMWRRWDVAQMGCRADGISRSWNVAQLSCRADGMWRRWGLAQKNVAQMMWTRFLYRLARFGIPRSTLISGLDDSKCFLQHLFPGIFFQLASYGPSSRIRPPTMGRGPVLRPECQPRPRRSGTTRSQARGNPRWSDVRTRYMEVLKSSLKF